MFAEAAQDKLYWQLVCRILMPSLFLSRMIEGREIFDSLQLVGKL